MRERSQYVPGQTLVIVAGTANTDEELQTPRGPEEADLPYHFLRVGTLVQVQAEKPWGGAQVVVCPVEAVSESWSPKYEGFYGDLQVLYDFHAKPWNPPPTDINDLDAWLNEEEP